MTKMLWIFSRQHRWWTNGTYIVTEEIGERLPIKTIQGIIYNDTGYIICKDTFYRWRVTNSEWNPLSPEEVMRILDGETYSNVVGNRK
jgi:hypothetical protein